MANLHFEKSQMENDREMTPPASKLSKINSSFYTKAGLLLLALLIIAGAIYLFTGRSDEPKNREAVFSKPDGSVAQVEEYLKANVLENPDSFTPIHWSKLRKADMLGMTTYKVALVYKAKNSNDEFFMDSKIFELDEKGAVLFMLDVEPMKRK
jgi:hypothetical protein